MVSPVGLGTVKLGRKVGVKYPAPFELPDDRAARELLATARDLGVNLIDTAPAYGTAEERLGGLLADERDAWVIVSKAGEGHDGGFGTADFSPASIAASVERSLQRLRTDRIDVLLLHPVRDDEESVYGDPGVVGVLGRMKREGKVRAIGASTRTVAGGLAALEWADVVMVTLNPQKVDELPVVEAARERGKGVLIKKALLSGWAGAAAGGASAQAPSAEACLRFALETPGVSSVVVGTINLEHLRSNVVACS